MAKAFLSYKRCVVISFLFEFINNILIVI